MDTVAETVLPGQPEEGLHTEGEVLFGYEALGWAAAANQFYDIARESFFNSGGGILTRRQFLTQTMFQAAVPARGLILLARCRLPVILTMNVQARPAPKPTGIKLATG
jgi:hypothetical protein